jgi:hypothetical protein
MPPKVESFFRFLFTHAMGAFACFLVVFSLSTLTNIGRFIPLLLLLAGLTFAWRYRHQTPRTRDAIITMLCAPITIVISYNLCLGSAPGISLPVFASGIYLGLLVLSSAAIFSAGRGDYWKTLRLTLSLLMVLGPVSCRFIQSGGQ